LSVQLSGVKREDETCMSNDIQQTPSCISTTKLQSTSRRVQYECSHGQPRNEWAEQEATDVVECQEEAVDCLFGDLPRSRQIIV